MTTHAIPGIWSHDAVIRAEWLATGALWLAGLTLAGLCAPRLYTEAASRWATVPDFGTEVYGAPGPTSSQPAQNTCTPQSGELFMPADTIVAGR